MAIQTQYRLVSICCPLGTLLTAPYVVITYGGAFSIKARSESDVSLTSSPLCVSLHSQCCAQINAAPTAAAAAVVSVAAAVDAIRLDGSAMATGVAIGMAAVGWGPPPKKRTMLACRLDTGRHAVHSWDGSTLLSSPSMYVCM